MPTRKKTFRRKKRGGSYGQVENTSFFERIKNFFAKLFESGEIESNKKDSFLGGKKTRRFKKKKK